MIHSTIQGCKYSTVQIISNYSITDQHLVLWQQQITDLTLTWWTFRKNL